LEVKNTDGHILFCDDDIVPQFSQDIEQQFYDHEFFVRFFKTLAKN